jgi:hypothetical protein
VPTSEQRLAARAKVQSEPLPTSVASPQARVSSSSIPPARTASVRIPLPFAPPETERDLDAIEASGRIPTQVDPVESSPPRGAGEPQVDLSSVAAFADLADESRAAFAACARVVALAMGDEVPATSLSLVLDGELFVSAAVVDAPALTLRAHEVASARGTTVASLALRLIASSDQASVALWTDDQVNEAFRSCPWVLEELQALGDKLQAHCGITVGMLGERLDTSLLAQITGSLEVQSFAPGDVILRKGAPVGVIIVGVGSVSVVNARFAPGSVVFSDRILSGGCAPADVIAGLEGAVVLIGPRSAAQELLATCPPLVEVLSEL